MSTENTLATSSSPVPMTRQIVEAKRESIAGFLPDPKTLERFIRSAAFALARNPSLGNCSTASLQQAICTAAELNLDFSPALGLAYVVPYGNQAQFQIGYRGLVTLAVRHGAALAIEAHVVHAGDKFTHRLGTGGFIHHERAPLGTDRGAPVGAYALATLPGGVQQFDVMDAAEIRRIQGRAKSGQSGPWKTDEMEMWKKTVTRRLCKYLNLSPEIGRALEVDNEDHDAGREVAVVDPARRSLADRLKDDATDTPPSPAPVKPGEDSRPQFDIDGNPADDIDTVMSKAQPIRRGQEVPQ